MGSTVSRKLRQRAPGALPHPIAASAMAIAMAFAAAPSWANPQGGVAIVGSATVTSNGNQMVVTTQNGAGQNYSAINWQSFSVPAGSSTYFQQPSASSTVINRVVTSTPSLIYGSLGSNGNLVLVNQSGITVGAGAVVDTAGFTASALRMSDADALAGRLRFGEGESQTGAVSVQGQVLARTGDVVLLGANVDTGSNALIQAPNGNVLLAAGQQVDITGRGLEGIVLRVQAPTDTVVNLGKLQGDAVAMFASSLHHSGDIQAQAVTVEGGKVVLKATQSAQVDGSITAKALNNTGGSVMVTADKVALGANALVDVRGAQGGGEALIGGGFQGKDTRISNSEQTTVAAGAQIMADATVSGNGGNIVVWANENTAVHGSLSAQGAGANGNGGNLETSGHHLDVSGISVNAKASGTGKAGDWLLDPYDITIASGYGGAVLSGDTFVSSTNSSLLDVNSVVTALNNGTSVTITTGGGAGVGVLESGDITVASPINVSSNANANSTLTLNAANNVVFNSNVSTSGGKLNLEVNATNSIVIGGNGSSVSIGTNGGNVQMIASGGSITGYGGSITTQGGNVVLFASNSIDSASFGNENLSIYSTGKSSSTGNGGTAGNISAVASYVNLGAVYANGGSTVANGASGGNAGAITIAATNCGECSDNGMVSSMSAAGANGYGGGVRGAGGVVSIAVDQTITLGGITADVLNFSNSGNGMTLASSTIKSMNLSAAGAITVNTNGLTQFSAVTTGSNSSVSLTNSGALTVGTIVVADGNVTVDNTGALTTVGPVKAAGSGVVNLTAHSPITIGAGGISTTGAVTLAANTVGTNSNILLNGSIVSSGSSVNVSAYNSITQNSLVSGATGVSASSTAGSITFGPNGYSIGSPLHYMDVHGAVTVPTAPGTSLTQVFDPSTVLDLLVVASNDTGTVFTDNPFAPENRKKGDLVMEGQLCTP